MQNNRDGKHHMVARSGLDFMPGGLTADMIALPDIAHALSLQCRFGGHTREHYSVAQHSLLVVRILVHMGAEPDAQLAGLMHDAHEAYIGDVPTPIKHALGDLWFEFERRAEEAVWSAFGVSDIMVRNQALVAHADRVALATERRDLIRFDARRNLPWSALVGIAPLSEPSVPCQSTPEAWADHFIGEFHALREHVELATSQPFPQLA